MNIRTLLLTICLAAGLAAPGAVPQAAAPVPAQAADEFGARLIPWPAQIAKRDGVFVLADTTAVATDPAFAAEGSQLAAAFGLKAGGPGAEIQLKKVDGLPAEGYTLEVTPAGITLAASTPAGAFYGCQTLRQLAEGRKIPGASIQDAPRIAWRGFMLDVSRHFFDKEEVKARLDEMAAIKLNVFHWHLTDDHGWRIEIKKYPKLTEVGAWRPVSPQEQGKPHIVGGRYGGFYTQDDIREVVAYAAARHIRVVPEIDMPGHMSAAIIAYPELMPDNGWTPVWPAGLRPYSPATARCAALGISRPQTVQFCKDVLEETLALFPSPEIHVGGDEVFTEQWQACPGMRAYKERLKSKDWEEVQIAFQNDIAAFLLEKGRTAVFWNNIYRQTVDKRSINHFWRNMANARDFANNGFDVLMSPYVYYLDHQEFNVETTYNYDPLAIGVKAGGESRLRGIEGCEWTERISDVPELTRRIYPRLVAIAESGWTPQEQKDWPSFRKRLMNCPVVPEEIRKNLGKEAAKADPKPFHSPLAGKKAKDGQKPAPVPAGNLACWKSARFVTLDETAAVRPAGKSQADVNGLDGDLKTAALAGSQGQGWSYDVDLEALLMVKQLRLSFAAGEATVPLLVSVSADGIVWNTLYDKTPTGRSPLTIDFNPSEIRFIRVTQAGTGAQEEKNGRFMPIAELEAY